MKKLLHKKQIFLMTLFTIYLFELMLTQIFLDQIFYSGELKERGVTLHYIMMSFMALGFPLFGISQKLFLSIESRRKLFLSIYTLYFLGAVGAYFIKIPLLSIASSYITILTLGFLGGAIYYYVAEGFVEHPAIGRITGLCSAAAVLLQMALQSLLNFATLLIVIILGFALAVYGAMQLNNEWMFDEPLEYARRDEKEELSSKRDIITRIAWVAMVFIVISITDLLCVEVTASGNTIMYNWPRFGLAIGYVLIGFLADIGHGRYLHLTGLCSLLPTIIVPFLMQDGRYTVGMFIFYMVVGAQILSATLSFFRIAPKTSFPELFSSLGRFINACVEILMLIPFLSGLIPGLLLEIIMLVGIILALSTGGLLNASIPAQNKEAPDLMQLFSERFSLTPRERDLLEVLLSCDDNMKEVARKMAVSERVAYRHLSNVYEKTGTTSRLQLMRLYYEGKI